MRLPAYTLFAALSLSMLAMLPALAQDAAPKLPPPRTPNSLLKPTPQPSEAAAELEQFRQFLPKAFYDTPAYPERYRSAAEIRARDDYERQQGYKFDKIIRGDKHEKQIALTFDDGPHAIYTLQLLSVLRSTHTPATFFVVGKQVDKFPTLVQLEIIEGHEVGDHTYDHVNLTQIPPELIGSELDRCDDSIKKAVGTSVRFFRPPGGDYDADVIREAARRGYVTTLWTDDPGDYSSPGGDVILKRTLDRLENGAVILLHDGIPQTIRILPQLIAEARRRGYQFVSLSNLAEDNP